MRNGRTDRDTMCGRQNLCGNNQSWGTSGAPAGKYDRTIRDRRQYRYRYNCCTATGLSLSFQYVLLFLIPCGRLIWLAVNLSYRVLTTWVLRAFSRRPLLVDWRRRRRVGATLCAGRRLCRIFWCRVLSLRT